MRRGLARASFGTAHLIVLGIVVQAALAGFFLYSLPTLIHIHMQLGGALVAVSLVHLILVLAARFDVSTGLVPLGVVLVVFSAGQFALGLLGRNATLAAALHVPNAFILFAVAMLWITRARRALRGGR
jgi:hypothetical protein